MARTTVTSLLLLLALSAFCAPAAQARGGHERLDSVEKGVIKLVNRHRAQHGLHPLMPNKALARSADFHSWDMLRGDFFSHTSLDGRSMVARVSRFTRKARIGETLGYLQGRSGRSARAIVDGWMASPGHRAALLSSSFSRVGVARRKGRFGRGKATVVTANLSSRR